jgi:hypothetical protein
MYMIMKPVSAGLVQRNGQALVLVEQPLGYAVIGLVVFMQPESHEPQFVVRVRNGQGVAERGPRMPGHHRVIPDSYGMRLMAALARDYVGSRVTTGQIMISQIIYGSANNTSRNNKTGRHSQGLYFRHKLTIQQAGSGQSR